MNSIDPYLSNKLMMIFNLSQYAGTQTGPQETVVDQERERRREMIRGRSVPVTKRQKILIGRNTNTPKAWYARYSLKKSLGSKHWRMLLGETHLKGPRLAPQMTPLLSKTTSTSIAMPRQTVLCPTP